MADDILEDGPQINPTGGVSISPDASVIDAGGGGDEVNLPEGFNFGTATFSPADPDLVMTSPSGEQVIIKDFYSQDPVPDIHTPEGGELAGSTAMLLAGPKNPGEVAQAGPGGVDAQPIGQVESIEGTVTAIRANGEKVELQVGDPVFQGDVLESADDSAVGVVLADESTFSMAEGGKMVLDEMVYDPGTQEGNISMSVLNGVFTFVSGQVAKVDPDAMVLKTPVATIGIRGTQVGLDLTELGEGGEGLKVVLMEESDGFVGEVVISNNAGIQILNLPDQGASITSSNAAPSEPRVFDRGEVREFFESALDSLPTEVGTGNNYGIGDEQQSQNQSEENEEAIEEFETAAGGEDEVPVDEFAQSAEAAGDQVEEVAAEEALSDGDDLAEFETAAGDEEPEAPVDEFAQTTEPDADETAVGGLDDGENLGEFETAAGGEEGGEETDQGDSVTFGEVDVSEFAVEGASVSGQDFASETGGLDDGDQVGSDTDAFTTAAAEDDGPAQVVGSFSLTSSQTVYSGGSGSNDVFSLPGLASDYSIQKTGPKEFEITHLPTEKKFTVKEYEVIEFPDEDPKKTIDLETYDPEDISLTAVDQTVEETDDAVTVDLGLNVEINDSDNDETITDITVSFTELPDGANFHQEVSETMKEPSTASPEMIAFFKDYFEKKGQRARKKK